MNTQSEQINELATALAKAQGQITGALKDSSNPFFKSKYADLASCWEACRKQLSDNGLSVVQPTDVIDGHIVVRTILAHSSGQWISGILPVKAKDDGPQAQGSGITYARRYALAAIVGLAQIDDDAEAAQGRHDPRGETWKKVDTKKVNEYAQRIFSAIESGIDGRIREVMHEVKEGGDDFRIAVWAALPKSVQDKIRDVAKEAA